MTGFGPCLNTKTRHRVNLSKQKGIYTWKNLWIIVTKNLIWHHVWTSPSANFLLVQEPDVCSWKNNSQGGCLAISQNGLCAISQDGCLAILQDNPNPLLFYKMISTEKVAFKISMACRNSMHEEGLHRAWYRVSKMVHLKCSLPYPRTTSKMRVSIKELSRSG